MCIWEIKSGVSKHSYVQWMMNEEIKFVREINMVTLWNLKDSSIIDKMWHNAWDASFLAKATSQ